MEDAEYTDTPNIDADADVVKNTNTPAQAEHPRKVPVHIQEKCLLLWTEGSSQSVENILEGFGSARWYQVSARHKQRS